MTSPEVTEADSVDTDVEQRLARIRELEDRLLQVIVNHKGTPLSAIRVFFDRGRTIP